MVAWMLIIDVKFFSTQSYGLSMKHTGLNQIHAEKKTRVLYL